MNTRKGGSRDPRKSAKSGKTRQCKSAPGKPASRTTKPVAKKTSSSDENKVSDKSKRKYIDYKIRTKKGDPMPKFNDDSIRLNKFLSNAGICSRREADVLIQTGVVKVNDKVVTELGFRVAPTDKVQYDEETIRPDTKRYVLLNKPKGFVTNLDDALGRRNTMSLVAKACKELVFPVDKLDRETTGLLLFTNDGDLAKKLTHPRFKSTKLYHVEVNKPVKKEDLETLKKGVNLDDGKAFFNDAEYVKSGTSREIGIEVSSGKNKIVQRALEALGYTVVKLDRVRYAGLHKKDLRLFIVKTNFSRFDDSNYN